MIKIDFITGFLGSGKTTFLLGYAKYLMSQGLKIGILEYDYGAINVDMVLLNELRGDKCELEMLAAACDADCLKRRFKTKLISMAMSGYDRVIVEPSGIFDMDMFFDDLREEPLENWYEIGSVIAVVNANLTDTLGAQEDFFLASQVASAGAIVLSRVQLSDEAHIEAIKAHMLSATSKIKSNRFAERMERIIVSKDWAEFTESDYEKLSLSGYHVGDYVKVIAGAELDFSSQYYLNLPDDIKSVKEKALAMLTETDTYGEVIRVKGFVNGGYRINASQYEMQIEREEIEQAAIIVIGKNLEKEAIDELIKGRG